MEEIKIYKSFWKFDLGMALMLTFIIWGIYMLVNKEDGYKAGPIIVIGMFSILAVVSVVRFARRRPHLIISENALTVNTDEPWQVSFKEVESFIPSKCNGQDVIGVRYKQGTPNWASEEAICSSQKSRIRYPENLHPGKPYEIYVSDLSVRCQSLCEMLNQRLRN